MSRFFVAGSSSSSEDEDEFVVQKSGGRFSAFYNSDEESSQEDFSEEESEEEEVTETESEADDQQDTEAAKRNRFLFGLSSDEESEDEGHRQVKSQKDKAVEEFESICDTIEDAVDEQEWLLVQSEYEKLMKLMSKNAKFIPSRVFELLKMLESTASGISNEEKKMMNAGDAKAFNAVRQKNKKMLVQYADELGKAEGGQDDEQALESKAKAEEALAPKVIEMIPENVLRKLLEVVGSRGRKHADKQENLSTLRKLYSLSGNNRHKIQVLVGTIAAEFDMLAPSLGYLPLDIWSATVQDTIALIRLLKELNPEEVPALNQEAEDLGLPGFGSLQGSLLSFVQRLDDEFTRALQIIDPNTSEYEEYLAAEPTLYSALQLSFDFFSSAAHSEFQVQIILRKLDHLYFRSDSDIHAFGADNKTVIQLCQKLYQSNSEKAKIRALLSHVYHLALHGHYTRARDIFVGSHVSEHLANLDVSTQILYNRTVVRLGLTAFQSGLLKEAYLALQEICSSGRPREFLAQGLQAQKYVERTPEQERAERQRQLPAHMHISIELIDSIFLTASMLLEIPQAAAAARRFFRGDRKLFSCRHLRRLIDNFDRNLFNGPPENTRDHIISAAKALANGQWKQCQELLFAAKLWDLLPNPAQVQEMLVKKIKEAGFCTFVLAFGPTYSSLSLKHLSDAFELSEAHLEKIVSKLIEEHGLPVRVDQGFLVWTQDVEISPLQELILQVRDKLSVLSERNQESLEIMDRTVSDILAQ